MSDPQTMVRTMKGMRASLAGLKIVNNLDSIPCPVCDDDETPCLNCFGVGWIIPDIDDPLRSDPSSAPQ